MRPASAAAGADAETPRGAEDFSLLLGGPLYQLLLRARLVRPPLELLTRRMLVIPALAWVPLLALTVWEGNAIGGVGTPFLYDIEAYARFSVAMPLLVLAEVVVHRQLRKAIRAFHEHWIVPSGSIARFHDAVARAMRLRDLVIAEIALLATKPSLPT